MTRSRLLTLLGLALGALALAAVTVIVVLPHASGPRGGGIGGPFTLTSDKGQPITEAALKGHPTLVFFGYTHCPDVCPATLAEISAVFKALGPDPRARALFVTVDPARDTVPVMKDYMSSFDPRITGVTGTPEQIKEIENAYKVYAKAGPQQDGAYTMDHTAVTYLMDKTGAFVGAFNLDRPAKDAAAELKGYF